MTEQPTRDRSHLFSVRIWMEDSGDAVEYRGTVQHVLSGELKHFREWDTLSDFFVAQVANGEVVLAPGRKEAPEDS